KRAKGRHPGSSKGVGTLRVPLAWSADPSAVRVGQQRHTECAYYFERPAREGDNMRTHHKPPSLVSMWMLDVFCCALGCVTLLFLLNSRMATDEAKASKAALTKLEEETKARDAALKKAEEESKARER